MSKARVKVRFNVSKDINMISKSFIVNSGANMGNVLFIAKSRIKDLNANEALFMFIDGRIIPSLHEPISFYFDKYQVNGVLNVELTKESCFGGGRFSKAKRKKGEWLYYGIPSPVFNSPNSPEVRRLLKKWIEQTQKEKDTEKKKYSKI